MTGTPLSKSDRISYVDFGFNSNLDIGLNSLERFIFKTGLMSLHFISMPVQPLGCVGGDEGTVLQSVLGQLLNGPPGVMSLACFGLKLHPTNKLLIRCKQDDMG